MNQWLFSRFFRPSVLNWVFQKQLHFGYRCFERFNNRHKKHVVFLSQITFWDTHWTFDSRGLGVYNLYNIYLIFRIQPSTDCLHILAPLKDICLYYMFNKFLYHCLVTMIYLIFCKICYFYQSYILFNLCQDSLKVFLKVLINVIPFLSFKGAAFAYLLKLLTTHKKSRNPLFYVLINCISAISGHQI